MFKRVVFASLQARERAMRFPTYRPRRLRRRESLRALVREHRVTVEDLIMPLFVREGEGIRKEIPSMPGNYQLSIDRLVKEAAEIESLGIPGVILFGIPEKKDAMGSGAYSEDGIIQRALRALKETVPGLLLMADTCLCEYTEHGHCGPVCEDRDGLLQVDNDGALELIRKTAVSQAVAGVDVVAPSGMMDGMVQAIRAGLDEGGYGDIAILSYAVKYASSFYGPFRDAAESPPQFGDRRAYQMDPPNALEALREAKMDIDEGADIIMVKPALAYMDIIYRVKRETGFPVAAYHVSGEFAMIKAAADRGWIDERQIVLEILTGLKRAGADFIFTYHAKDVARWLRE
jgi:porphobilinogen synthase